MPAPRSSSRIHLATLSRKYRSCVIATTVPGNSARCRSSHATLSASRWLVGSSSSSMSGCSSSTRQSATRRRSPPDSLLTSASHGGRRSASIAISIFVSRLHRSCASICSCTRACSASSFSIASSLIGSANAIEISLNRSSSARCAATASSTFPFTSSAAIELRLLRQVAHLHPVGNPRLALKVVVHPGHDAQQARLAGAVGAEHADLGAVVEGQPDPTQNLPLGRDDFAQILHDVDELRGHGRSGLQGGRES